jgi:hypothetical protein
MTRKKQQPQTFAPTVRSVQQKQAPAFFGQFTGDQLFKNQTFAGRYG